MPFKISTNRPPTLNVFLIPTALSAKLSKTKIPKNQNLLECQPFKNLTLQSLCLQFLIKIQKFAMNQLKMLKLARLFPILAMFIINQSLISRGNSSAQGAAKPTAIAQKTQTLPGKQQSIQQPDGGAVGQEEIDALWQALNTLKSSLEQTIKLDGEQEKDIGTMQNRIAALEAVIQNLIKQISTLDKEGKASKNATAISSEIADKQKTHTINPASRVEKRAQATPVLPDRPAPTPKPAQSSVAQTTPQNEANYQAWLNAAWPHLPEELKQIPQTPQEAQTIAYKLRQLFDAASQSAKVSAAKDYAGAIGQGLQGVPPSASPTPQSASAPAMPAQIDRIQDPENYDQVAPSGETLE